MRESRSQKIFSPLAPFRFQQFDFSQTAYQTAKRVVTQGETKIAELDKAICRLRARRTQFRAVVQQHRVLLAPIHRLPDEVLESIFEDVSDSSGDIIADSLLRGRSQRCAVVGETSYSRQLAGIFGPPSKYIPP